MSHPTPDNKPGEELVRVDDLRISYGETVAVQNVSLSIQRGEIFGILGPNGAGKTTTVECIGGLRHPDAGTIRVLGHDATRERDVLRKLVGIQLQLSELPDRLQVREALDLFASFYSDPRDPDELLARLGLEEQQSSRFSNLSGGQRQRLSIALALIGRPRLAILDELTTGLDPAARRETWRLIEDIRAQDVTVILVTHFMEEAEYLCDRVAVLNRGRVLAIDTPRGLAAGLGQRIHFRPRGELDPELLRELPGVAQVTVHDGRFDLRGGGDLVAVVMEALVNAGVVPLETRIEQSTLDEAFVQMTSEGAQESGNDPDELQEVIA